MLHVPALTLPETVVMGTGLAAYGSAYDEVIAPSLRPAKVKGPSGVRQLGTLDLRRGLHVCFRVFSCGPVSLVFYLCCALSFDRSGPLFVALLRYLFLQ